MQVSFEFRAGEYYGMMLLMLAVVSVHAFVIVTDYMPHFFEAESPIEELDFRVSYGLAGAYLAVVGIMLATLRPGDKSGIQSGKPFSGDEAKAVAMVKQWGSKQQLVVTTSNLKTFLNEKAGIKTKSALAVKEAKYAKALLSRDPNDIIGRLCAEQALVIDVRGAKSVYNAYQVLFNIIMVYIIVGQIWEFADHDIMKIWATPLVPGQAGRLYAFGLWLHYVNKFLEFSDTIFMGLSGSWRQVTTLHVVHHAIMGPIYYHVQTSVIGVNPGCTQAWFGSGLNSFIHVLMYGYYLLTGFGIRLDWFRMPLTIMQLLQFYAAFTHSLCNLYYRHAENQNWPLSTNSALIEAGTTVLMMVMFTDFFIKSYCASPRPSGTKTKST